MKHSRNFKYKVIQKENRVSSRILWTGVFILLVMEIYFAIQNSAMGANYNKIEEEISEVRGENQNLEESLIKATSLSELGGKAFDLGYKKDQEIISIKVGESYTSLFR